MAHPPQKNFEALDPAAKTKTLLAEFPGNIGVLLDQGSSTPMKFASSVAALKWCEKNQAVFYYFPPDPAEQN